MVTMKTIAAGEFKATCLKLMDAVAATGEPLEVTKRGKPLVRLVPAGALRPEPRSIFGAARDTILYLAPDDDLLATGAQWNAQR
jgi:prevent-host-death family protein